MPRAYLQGAASSQDPAHRGDPTSLHPPGCGPLCPGSPVWSLESKGASGDATQEIPNPGIQHLLAAQPLPNRLPELPRHASGPLCLPSASHQTQPASRRCAGPPGLPLDATYSMLGAGDKAQKRTLGPVPGLGPTDAQKRDLNVLTNGPNGGSRVRDPCGRLWSLSAEDMSFLVGKARS